MLRFIICFVVLGLDRTRTGGQIPASRFIKNSPLARFNEGDPCQHGGLLHSIYIML